MWSTVIIERRTRDTSFSAESKTKEWSVYQINRPERHSGKNPVHFTKNGGCDCMWKSFSEGKDRGVTISSSLSRDTLIHSIVAKANKLLGLQKKSCPLITDINLRRTLYLLLVI